MASQLQRVTGSRRLRYDPRAGLQAKIARLPQMQAQKQQREVIARDTAFQNKQIALARKSAAQRKREQQAGMGLEAAKLGFTVGMGDIGKTTIGDITAGTRNIFKGKEAPKVEAKETGISGINVGAGLASGLAGFGVGKMVGGKKKLKKAGFGAGAGALMGLLSGKSLIAGGIGGLMGGLGGYFS